MRPRTVLGLVLVLVLAACSDDTAVTTSTGAAAAEDSTTTTTAKPSSTTVATATATTGPTTSTEATTTTTTSSSTTTTTTTNPPPPPTTTTTTAPSEPSGNLPPSASITFPPDLSAHQASFDPGAGLFGAAIAFTADATDPNGDPITVQWFSSDEGLLGTGPNLTATIHTIGSDSSQPFITVRVTDQWGRVTESQIQIIVVIWSST